jgi:hypothetical protein
MRKLLLVLLLVVYPAYGQDYTVTQVEAPPLQNIYEKGGTNLNLSDDGVATNINIGFDFEFYGNIFDTINISNNGFITFTGLNSRCCQGMPLPAMGMDNSIMALWTDLISVNDMNPYYKSYAIDGDRVFTVGWYNTLEYYNPEWTNTFEITLYEGSNNILFNYENLNVYQHTLTAGIQGTDGQSEQIYTGNSTQSLANSAYLFTYTAPEPEDPIAPNCITNPTYIDCIIDSTPDPIYTVDDNTSNDEDLSVAETNELNNEPTVIGGEVDLEALLAQNSQQTEEIVEEDEEKEEELKDDITTDILEQVLATVETTETDRKDRSLGSSEETDEIIQVANISETTSETVITDDTQTSEMYSIEETSVENVSETSVANTETTTVVETTIETNTIDETEIVVENNNENSGIEETVEQTIDIVELPVFVQNVSESVIETITVDSIDNGEIQEETFVFNQIEQSTQIDNDLTNEIMSISIAQSETDIESVENNIVGTAQQKTFDDEQTEDEQLTMAYVQPGSNVFTNNNLFNVESNMADKEMSGVLGKTEEKSDAEKRAEEVVAANKEQQEEINKNYMEADQSGILAAIGSDTDVSSYRSAMLRDNNIWYKPEDIYKNIVYKDNVRGAYFLEKGNTDTYKKMVEEQYK